MGARTFLVLALAVLVSTGTAGAAWGETREAGCRLLSPRPGYAGRVEQALRATQDVWGNELLRARGGPTYDGARRFLAPLLLARGPRASRLTGSGFHYLAFTHPSGPAGSGSAALHVADGSEIVSRRVGGPILTIAVGPRGREPYGSCLARLTLPRLEDGYLPILRTGYVDPLGVRYAQESFAARLPGEASLTSFVALNADARFARSDAEIRFVPDDERALVFELPARMLMTSYVAWRGTDPARVREVDRASYEAARASVVRYWRGRLSEGASIQVPERRVQDAVRALLLQNLGLGWRYSIGNPYQQLSFPEALDVAHVMSAYGFADVAREILRRAATTPRGPYPSWRLGQRLVGAALHYRLFRDRALVAELTPDLRQGLARLAQRADGPRGLLRRERYSSDIPDLVHGLHSQAVVWQGLEAMARVWATTGYSDLAARSRALAARLEIALRSAVHASQRTLPDGSLFVPVRLLDDERPYGTVTESRAGSYWNLVAPYAFASGLFAPGSPQAEGILRYLFRHGARLLGLVRAGAYSMYGRDAPPWRSGVNPVYGLNTARFLAANDRPDQLVLSLYGQLAAGMAPGTFVAGEAVSVAPLGRERLRSAYLPPNAASNGSFLETLRLLLVHETRDRRGAPSGLELAHATPRAWLAPGRRIAVRDLPTSFGPVSFSIRSQGKGVRVALVLPTRGRPRTTLRLRLPRGDRVLALELSGRRLRRFDRANETVDLTGLTGRLELLVRVARP